MAVRAHVIMWSYSLVCWTVRMFITVILIRLFVWLFLAATGDWWMREFAVNLIGLLARLLLLFLLVGSCDYCHNADWLYVIIAVIWLGSRSPCSGILCNKMYCSVTVLFVKTKKAKQSANIRVSLTFRKELNSFKPVWLVCWYSRKKIIS